MTKAHPTTYLSGILSAIITSLFTFVCINSIFSVSTNDWSDALGENAWFAWILLIAVFLVPMITGFVCGNKGCGFFACFALAIIMEILALIISFIIGFIAALFSVLLGDLVGIAVIVSLFIAFTATPTVVIAIIE